MIDKCDKVDKSDKSDKSDKVDKSDKSDKSDKVDKSDKSATPSRSVLYAPLFRRSTTAGYDAMWRLRRHLPTRKICWSAKIAEP